MSFALRLVVLLLLLGTVLPAEPVPSLAVVPAAAPRNLYRWQLLPGLLIQKPGDAVEVYRKATAAIREVEPDRQAFGKLYQELDELRQAPLKDVDRKRLGEIVEQFKKPLELIAEAARREHADWEFVVERLKKSGIGALLGEVQEVREFLPLLVAQARHHLLEDRPEEAVRVAATGFALARQMNECPTLISHLVALAITQITLDILQDCVQHPKCPSLHGPLTDMPRPFLTPRHGYEGERLSAYGTIPILMQLRANPLHELDGEAREQIVRLYRGLAFDGPTRPELAFTDRFLLGAEMKKKYPAARKMLQAAGYDAATIDKMPVLNASLLHAILQYEEDLGRMAAAAMLPYPQARGLFEELEKKYPRGGRAAGDDAAFPLARLLLPAALKIAQADLRLQRRLELLRAAEALRQHASRTGRWPDKLADVEIAMVPNDPGTGRPFGYTREGDVAVLSTTLLKPGLSADHAPGLRLTLRKPQEKNP